MALKVCFTSSILHAKLILSFGASIEVNIDYLVLSVVVTVVD